MNTTKPKDLDYIYSGTVQSTTIKSFEKYSDVHFKNGTALMLSTKVGRIHPGDFLEFKCVQFGKFYYLTEIVSQTSRMEQLGALHKVEAEVEQYIMTN